MIFFSSNLAIFPDSSHLLPGQKTRIPEELLLLLEQIRNEYGDLNGKPQGKDYWVKSQNWEGNIERHFIKTDL